MERWFWSSNAKDIGILYLIFALFSGLLGTAFSVLIRMELSGPGVQYIADNQLYNSIITAHAILMIFFMVDKNFYMLYIKSEPSLITKEVNNDNYDEDEVIIGNGNNNNSDENSNESKHKYVKVLVKDPFNNRDLILRVSKKQKGIYLWESLDGKNKYVGHSINLYNLRTLTTSSVPTSTKENLLNPWFLTGFCDGESSFYIVMHKSTNVKTGWSVTARFEIHLHVKDKALLEKVQAYFSGVGSITTKDNSVCYTVYYKDLAVLIDHFENYPLITKKRADFELFKRVLELMNRKEHLTLEGGSN